MRLTLSIQAVIVGMEREIYKILVPHTINVYVMSSTLAQT